VCARGGDFSCGDKTVFMSAGCHAASDILLAAAMCFFDCVSCQEPVVQEIGVVSLAQSCLVDATRKLGRHAK